MGEEWDRKRIIAAFAKKNCGDYDRSLHKVDWEWEGIQKFQLPEKCLYVRGGFILGWAVERDLLTADRPVGYGISFKKELAQFKAGEITGPQFYELIDGSLTHHMFNPQCAKFLDRYLGSEQYERDMEEIAGAENYFALEDNEENYSKVKGLLDKRFSEFDSKG